jgi:hypothetical protein
VIPGGFKASWLYTPFGLVITTDVVGLLVTVLLERFISPKMKEKEKANIREYRRINYA